MKVLETAVGAVFAPTRFSLVRISIRDLVADRKSLVRSSGVGGGGENLILKHSKDTKNQETQHIDNGYVAPPTADVATKMSLFL